MGAVAIVVAWVAVVVAEIVPSDHLAAGADCDAPPEIGMAVVDPGVDDRDHPTRAAIATVRRPEGGRTHERHAGVEHGVHLAVRVDRPHVGMPSERVPGTRRHRDRHAIECEGELAVHRSPCGAPQPLEPDDLLLDSVVLARQGCPIEESAARATPTARHQGSATQLDDDPLGRVRRPRPVDHDRRATALRSHRDGAARRACQFGGPLDTGDAYAGLVPGGLRRVARCRQQHPREEHPESQPISHAPLHPIERAPGPGSPRGRREVSASELATIRAYQHQQTRVKQKDVVDVSPTGLRPRRCSRGSLAESAAALLDAVGDRPWRVPELRVLGGPIGEQAGGAARLRQSGGEPKRTTMAKPAAVLDRFEGFADAERRFFRKLARNQRREWWEEHRAEYDTGWLAPMRALLDEVRERIEADFPQQPLAAPKVFRIHRDVRFSKDKSPYKTHIGGYIGIEGAGAGPSAPAPLYLHLGVDEAFACAGHYMMDGAQLRASVRRLPMTGRAPSSRGCSRRSSRRGSSSGRTIRCRRCRAASTPRTRARTCCAAKA